MAQQFVENVLAVHKKYLEMMKGVFQGDQAFIGALDKACNAVINYRQPKQPSKAPELVSITLNSLILSYFTGNIFKLLLYEYTCT